MRTTITQQFTTNKNNREIERSDDLKEGKKLCNDDLA
jgi:hypothetical protein